MIGDAVLQPLESRIRMMRDMLDLIQDREGVRSDYVYHEKSVLAAQSYSFTDGISIRFVLSCSWHAQDGQEVRSPR